MKIVALTLAGACLTAPVYARNADKEQAAWFECIRTAGAVFAEQVAAPETVADATLGACVEQEEAFRTQLRKTPPLERMLAGPRSLDKDYSDSFDKSYNRQRDGLRSSIVAATLNYRAGHKFSSEVLPR